MNDLVKEITVLDVVQWIATLLRLIQADMKTKCFLKAGFICEKFNENPVVDEVSENLITIQKLCRGTHGLVEPTVYITINDALISDHTFQSGGRTHAK